MIRVSKDQLADMAPCDLDTRLAMFGCKKYMTAEQAFAACAKVSDVLWVMGRLGLGTLCAKFAELCAERADADAAAAADAARYVARYAAVADAAAAAAARYAADDAAADAAAAAHYAAARYAADAADAAAEIELQKADLIRILKGAKA